MPLNEVSQQGVVMTGIFSQATGHGHDGGEKERQESRI
jgi:hypothetical protein